jgi:hypothetical protein
MRTALAVLKALSVMVLAAFGAGNVVAGFRSYYDAGFNVGLGVFLLLGAFFLYRAWFARR